MKKGKIHPGLSQRKKMRSASKKIGNQIRKL